MIDSFLRQLSQLWKDDVGADLIEYGLIGGMIAAAGVAVFPSIFDKLGGVFDQWGDNVYDEWEPDNPASYVPMP